MEARTKQIWDTHVHCFDPARHPFKPTRKYTPAAAPLEALVNDRLADRVVIVQASIENGPSGLMNHLVRIRAEYPHLLARGIISMDESWDSLREEDVDKLHDLGVRFCRIHQFSQGVMTDASPIMEQFRAFAASYAYRKWGWGISAQLPLKIWASLKDCISQDPHLSRLKIIADHVGCASPADFASPEFDTFVQLLQDGRLMVKISALYRRSPEAILKMKPIIQKLAESAPDALLWGSDWPHVDSTQQSLDPPAVPKEIDVQQELLLLQSWLSQDQWEKMVFHNPERIFWRMRGIR